MIRGIHHMLFMKNTTFHKKRSFPFLLSLLSSLLILSSCSKEREATLSDEDQENIFQMVDYRDKEFAVSLSSDQHIEDLKSGETIKKFAIEEVKAEDQVKKLFHNFYVEGEAGAKITILLQLKSDGRLVAFKKVTADELAQLSKFEQSLAISQDQDALSLVELFSYKIDRFGTLERSKNDLGEQTHRLVLKESSFEKASHFQANFLNEKVLPTEKDLEELKKLGLSKFLKLQDFQHKSFLYRRTLIDSPGNFPHSFAGSAGDLEIVTFFFKEDLLEIKRSYDLLHKEAASDVDQETLLAFPVTYYKYKKTDNQGRPLSAGQLVKTTFTDPKAMAYVSWEKNSIPNISSPISYFGVERCFGGANTREITDLAQVSGQTLHFTLGSVYVSNSSMDCVEEKDYFGSGQYSFTFKERVSFKAYQTPVGSEKPLLDLPYETQKKFGFGLFTHYTTKPSPFGETHTKGTSVPLPSLFDLRKETGSEQFKQITYVLAGIPKASEKPELRKKLIVATKEVIADLNKAFAEAFIGTAMERTAPVVNLMVEELSPAEEEELGLKSTSAGVMGDLDRNYIYYVQKPTDLSIIGLGGSHANPLSGRTEAASVFIYGGNIKSSIPGLRLRDKAERDYRHLTTPNKLQVQMFKMQNPSIRVLSTERLAGTGVRPAVPTPPSASSTNIVPLARFQNQAESFNVSRKTLPTTSLDIDHLSSKDLTQQWKSLKDHHDSSERDSLNQKLSYLNHDKSLKEFYLKFHTATDKQAIQDPYLMESIFEGKMVDQKLVQKPKQKFISEVIRKIQAHDQCVFDARDGLASLRHGSHLSTSTMSDDDLLIGIYKPTLAHELGHNVGLRHNFMGSYDSRHFLKTNEVDEQGRLGKLVSRDYSSIMDYLNHDHESYDGFGPQDIYALRAAYTGTIKIPKNPFATTEAARTRDQFVTFPQIKETLNLEHWEDLTTELVESLNFPHYKFCSDEDVGSHPLCDRFDSGSTPLEIIENAIYSYKVGYSYRNFPGERSTFQQRSSGYLSSIFGSFAKIRSFLDGIVLYFDDFDSSENNAEEFQSMINAALVGQSFFNDIIRTPIPSFDTSSKAPNSRFKTAFHLAAPNVVIPYVVEEKWHWNVMKNPGDFDNITVRGIDIDKYFATLFLLGDHGNKFLRDGLSPIQRLSYYHLEQYVNSLMQKINPTPRAGNFLSFAKDIMLNEVTPIKTISFEIPGVPELQRKTISLGDTKKTYVDQSMRKLSEMALVFDLNDPDHRTLDEDASSAFRVYSRTRPQVGIPFVQVTGTDATERYWADEDSLQSHDMISKSFQMQKMQIQKKEIVETIQSILKIQNNVKPVPTDTVDTTSTTTSTDDQELAQQADKLKNLLSAYLPNMTSFPKEEIDSFIAFALGQSKEFAESLKSFSEIYDDYQKLAAIRQDLDKKIKEAYSDQSIKLDPTKLEALKADIAKADATSKKMEAYAMMINSGMDRLNTAAADLMKSEPLLALFIDASVPESSLRSMFIPSIYRYLSEYQKKVLESGRRLSKLYYIVNDNPVP
jgi:hypothetical protein